MLDNNNSIKDILNDAKEKLSKDKELKQSKEDFSQKLSKALDGNILTLNKVCDTVSSDNIDNRSKKITEIVEYQSALLLKNEVNYDKSALLLENEIKDELDVLELNQLSDSPLLLNREYEGEYSEEINEISNEIRSLKEKSEEKDPFIERIERLEEKQQTLFNKVDEAINLIQSKDPSEEIALKFDILNNQISNDIDEKNEILKSDLQSSKEQQNILEERLLQIESTSDHLRSSIENLDHKLDQLAKDLNDNVQQQTSKLESSQLAMEDNSNNKIKEIENQIDSRFDLIQSEIKSSLDHFATMIEQEKLKQEEAKKNDPEYQSNLRMNSIFKILEMQVSQSLIQNMPAQPKTALEVLQPKEETKQSYEPKEYIINNKEVLEKLNQLSDQINTKVQFDDSSIRSILTETQSKIEQLENKLRENNENKDAASKQIDHLMHYFKSSELKNLEDLSINLSEIKQFDEIDQAKKFIESLLLKETQNWIEKNQKTIEDICNKIIYK